MMICSPINIYEQRNIKEKNYNKNPRSMQQNCKVPQHSRAISKRSSTLPFTVQSVRLENGKIRTEKRAQTYFLFISMIASRPVRPDGLCMAEQPIATNGK